MTIHYERRGNGEPLVLLHGIGHHWRAWEPVLDRLAEHHDVWAIDLPGFGRSPVNTTDPDLGLAAWFAAMGLDRPHVAGNSLGGALALELAAAGRVGSVTALSPAGFGTGREIRRSLRILAGLRTVAFTPEPLLRLINRSGPLRRLGFALLVAEPGNLTPERALADTLAFKAGKGFRRVAHDKRAYQFTDPIDGIPVTIAWGTRDRILPYHQHERARQLLPAARHTALEGLGHVPMSDDPQLVADVILKTTGKTDI